MNGNASFLDAGRNLCAPETALDAFDGHGDRGNRPLIAGSADRREDELWIPVRAPVAAKQGIG